MLNLKCNCTYFLAANSGEGFISLFNELYNPRAGWKLYIIKGGPGTGKSSLIRKICQKASELGYCSNKIICSSDPDSLDGAIIPDIKIAVCDGTSPHIMDPVFPGVSEKIINLGECWDENSLSYDSSHIITLTDCNKELHRKCTNYLAAAASAAKDNKKILHTCTDFNKIDNYALRIISKFSNDKSEKGEMSNFFINGNTPYGRTVLYESALEMCETIVSISDEYNCISTYLIDKLASYALSKGKNVVVSLNPLIPSTEPLHLILPEEKIGFFTSNSQCNFKPYASKNINVKRFSDKNKINTYKNRLMFNKKACDSFTDEAINIMKKAKSVHDELEKYYIKAMDFEKLNSISDMIIAKIFNYQE